MTTNHADIARAWARNITGLTAKAIPTARGNVNPDGDRIYSYGWWEMARLIRHTTGPQKGEPLRFLVNGDVYSVSTSRHQSYVRDAIASTGLPSITLPYSVLDEAGIDRATVTPIDVTADRTETITEYHTDQPPAAVWEYEQAFIPGTGVYVHKTTGETLPSSGQWNFETSSYSYEYDHRRTLAAGNWTPGAADDDERSYASMNARRASFEAEWDHYPALFKNTGHKTLRVAKNGYQTWDLVADETTPQGIGYTRDRYRHWLGESLLTGTVSYWDAKAQRTRTRTARFLSGFDQNETRPSYFFCELPRTSKATTVAEAYEDLKPATVKTAEAIGRTVHRQGDIFAVPLSTLTTAQLTRQGATRTKATHILGTNHQATEVATVRNGKATLTYIRGTLTHAPLDRRPDHKRVTVGKQWHLVLKNTVPVAA